ncbi:hypothetical protein ESCO_004378 [Escovopsis weberi]|uniref:Uncharacterized protein n=1 Tax=Escovopsis weberi TaxID=150374 RepID=A0A0M9VVA5_ESCWE|nr:hypothetical protein ESCO_004378 [Escovopsis weberi]
MASDNSDNGLRNIIYTTVKVPEGASPSLVFDFADRNEISSLRAVIVLLLFLAPGGNFKMKAQIAIHLWQWERLKAFAHGSKTPDTDLVTTYLVRGCTQEPLTEWPMEFLDYGDGKVTNDVYGSFFYYLENMFCEFQVQLRRLAVKMTVYDAACFASVEAIKRTLHGKEYDRIEVGTLWDVEPQSTLAKYARFLRHEEDNRYATLLAATRQSVTQKIASSQKLFDEEKAKMYRPAHPVLDKYAPPVGSEKITDWGTITRRYLGLLLWRPWDEFSDRFIHHKRHLQVTEREKEKEKKKGKEKGKEKENGEKLIWPSLVVAEREMGLKLKKRNTVCRQWPNLPPRTKDRTLTLRDFNRWVGFPRVVPVRWLEWRRTGDPLELRILMAGGKEEFDRVGGHGSPVSLSDEADETQDDAGPQEEEEQDKKKSHACPVFVALGTEEAQKDAGAPGGEQVKTKKKKKTKKKRKR